MDKACQPSCRRCAHYYITHDVNFPYGCRALDFKSRRQPMLDVADSSGHPCLYFTVKTATKQGRPR